MKRNVKVIGISADTLQTHFEWIEDIIEIASKTAPACVEYPIVCLFPISSIRSTGIFTSFKDCGYGEEDIGPV